MGDFLQNKSVENTGDKQVGLLDSTIWIMIDIIYRLN